MYLTVQEGTLPIVLTAPHGGTVLLQEVPERTGKGAGKFVAVRDTNTDLLAERTAKEIEKRLGGKPFLIVAHFARKDVDVNRPAADAYESEKAKPYYEAYHRAVRDACGKVDRRWGQGLLIDIHAQGAESATVFRGTNDSRTVSALLARYGKEAFTGPNSLAGQLESKGYHLFPPCASTEIENSHFDGGYTVQTYGGRTRQSRGIAAIQLEFGAKFRTKKQLDTTASDLADAVQVFEKTYPAPTK